MTYTFDNSEDEEKDNLNIPQFDLDDYVCAVELGIPDDEALEVAIEMAERENGVHNFLD